MRPQSSKAIQARREQAEEAAQQRRDSIHKRMATYRVERPVAVSVPTISPQPKDHEYRNPKLLALANGQTCQNCFDEPAVAAHSNASGHGKGKSRKSHDCFHGWLGQRCHSWLDQSIGDKRDPTGTFDPTRVDKALMYQRAADRTLLEMWRQGLIKVAK